MTIKVFEFNYDRDAYQQEGSVTVYLGDTLLKTVEYNDPSVIFTYTFPVGELTVDPANKKLLSIEYNKDIEPAEGNVKVVSITGTLLQKLPITELDFS